MTNSDAVALAQDGYVFLPGFLPECTMEEAATRIGGVTPMERLQQSSVSIQDLRPRESISAPKNTYSGNFGLDQFPLHTDFAHWAVPPRYLLLRCVAGADSVATLVLPWKELLSGTSRSSLATGVFSSRIWRSGFSGLRRSLSMVGDVELFRWDSIFLAPLNSSAKELSALMRSGFWENRATRFVLAEQNDALLLDNWTVMHGREAVPGHQLDRHLQRAYLEEIIYDRGPD